MAFWQKNDRGSNVEKKPGSQWDENQNKNNHFVRGICVQKNVGYIFPYCQTRKQIEVKALVEFKILFDPTFGLKGGDKVQDESDLER